MKIIPNWRRAPRMLSMWVAAAAVIWSGMPADMQAAVLQLLGVPAERVPGVLGLLFILARLIDQPKIRQPAD